MGKASPLNLLTDKWLPMRRRSGEVVWQGACAVTDSIEDDPVVAFAWPRPDFNGAAMEFMVGLLSTATAPASDGDWLEWWSEPPPPSRLASCLAPLADDFELDGDGPRFLQDLDPLEEAERKDIAALLIDAPGAQTLRNNADLFVKRGGVPVLGRPAAAMALFALNAFAPSGGAGHRTSLRGGGPLTTLVVADHERLGDTLWGRLWANVETSEQVERRAPGRNEPNILPWVEPTRTSEKGSGRQTTPVDVHPLQVYWGMPRRIRLEFESTGERTCAVTGRRDDVVAVAYRTRNYGTHYSEGFEHPLSPYYRQKPGAAKLPVHPQPGGFSYRLWPGVAMSTADGLREPATAVRSWLFGDRGRRVRALREPRVHAFGYDMDNMKARAWVEGEMPLWSFDDREAAEDCEKYVSQIVAATATVGRLLVATIKGARHERPKDAKGDYGFVTERLYRETEVSFYDGVGQAVSSAVESDADDPTVDVRSRWPGIVRRVALDLFDEYAPSEGLDGRNMARHVRARFGLVTALNGRGKAGRSLFERDLGIPAPAPKSQEKRKEGDR